MADSVEVKSTKPWHESLAEFYILYPSASNTQAANHFKVSSQWISIVKNSDSFKELMRAKREAHAELISVSVINKVEALAEQAVDKLAEQLQTKDLPVEHVKDIAAMSLKAMGFGNGEGRGAPVQNNVNVFVDREALAEAREKLIASRQSLPVIEHKETEKE